jgi:MFS family permease
MPLALLLVLSSIAFITMKGSRILMTLYAVDLGAGPFETGILFALYGLFPFLLAIAAGRLADRFDNRLLIYWGLGTYTICLAIPYFFPSLAMLYVVAPLWGFTSMLWVVRRRIRRRIVDHGNPHTQLQLLQPGESTGR